MSSSTLSGNVARQKVVAELSKFILNQPVEVDNDSTSNLYKILVKRLRTQLNKDEEDVTACDTAARQLAKFVETVMREAYFLQKHRSRSSGRSLSATPCRSDLPNLTEPTLPLRKLDSNTFKQEKDSIARSLGFSKQYCDSPVVIEKVPPSFASRVPKCGPLYTAIIGGRKVYVQEVVEGETKKALITRVDVKVSDTNQGTTSWIVDLANKTKEWARWLDEKASLANYDSRVRSRHFGESSQRRSESSSPY